MLKHRNLGQKDRVQAKVPRPLPIHLEPFIRPRGLLSKKDCGICAKWKEAGVKGLEQYNDLCNIKATGAWNGDSGGAQP